VSEWRLGGGGVRGGTELGVGKGGGEVVVRGEGKGGGRGGGEGWKRIGFVVRLLQA